MNPGPIEEGAKVATGFIEVMKREPISLALVLMNLALLGLFWFVASTRSAEFKHVMSLQMETQKLLFNCTPVTPRG